MSWSLRIRNGDLAIDGDRLEIVTAEHKLIQDLKCHILERMGNDDAHPGFGSLIDGGQQIDGRIAEGVIGRVDWEFVRLEVEQDLRRIFSEHQAKQLGRAKADQDVFARTTLTAGEVLISVKDIQMVLLQTTMIILVTLKTAANNLTQLNIPFTLN